MASDPDPVDGTSDEAAVRVAAPTSEAIEVPEGIASEAQPSCDNGQTGESQISDSQFDIPDDALAQAAERLAVSPDARHRVVAALLDRQSDRLHERIRGALAAGPRDPVVLWQIYSLCRVEGHGCAPPGVEAALTDLDGENSEVWIRVAARRYRNGQHAEALEAVTRAAAAAETDIYWVETVESAYRALTAAGGFIVDDRIGAAFGLAAGSVPVYGDVSTMCRTESVRRTDWALACLDYGRTAEAQSKTYLGVSFALGLQKLALEALHEPDALDEVERREQALRDEFVGTAASDWRQVEGAVMRSERLLFAYLDALETGTEASARRRASEELLRIGVPAPESTCAE